MVFKISQIAGLIIKFAQYVLNKNYLIIDLETCLN